MQLAITIRRVKRFSRSEVKGQGHDHTQCYNGGGMHFDSSPVNLSVVHIALHNGCSTE